MNKKVSLGKTSRVSGDQTGDKKVCNNVSLYKFEGSFCLLQGHKNPPEKAFMSRHSPKKEFMAALFPRSCCFWSDKVN